MSIVGSETLDAIERHLAKATVMLLLSGSGTRNSIRACAGLVRARDGIEARVEARTGMLHLMGFSTLQVLECQLASVAAEWMSLKLGCFPLFGKPFCFPDLAPYDPLLGPPSLVDNGPVSAVESLSLRRESGLVVLVGRCLPC